MDHDQSHLADGIERIAPAKQYPVLYVDDEAENLLVFRAVFSDEFTVRTAPSGAEALQILDQEPVAVLVADQRMPHMSGIDLCHLVWQRMPQVRRMLLTAYSDHQTAIDAINRGRVHRYLEKPWDPLTMRRALWDAVNRVHLDRTVVELRGELAERDLRLEQARAKERLLHDVANASTRLSLTTAALRQLLERRGGTLPEDIRSELNREADALSRTSEHLVRLQSERVRGVGELKPERLRVEEVLRTVVALAAFPQGESIRLVVDSPPGLELEADRLSLARILVNLAQNARQAIETTGRHEGEVRVRVHSDGDEVVFDVADDGPGIAPKLRRTVFNEYFTTRSGRGGTGLGLATARGLAEANGGTLELPEPQPPRGALFRLTLPARVAETAAKHVDASPPGSHSAHH